MAQNQITTVNASELDRLATQLAKDPHSKAFMPLAEEYGKAGMWQEAAAVLEDGLKVYPGFITAMVALGRAYDHLGQFTKAKAILEESVKLSPENLRAHRTLIKIYQSQGLHESALRSCAVILAANPRDEEARSIQSALGAPAPEMKEPGRPKLSAPIKSKPSAAQTASTSASGAITDLAEKTSAALNPATASPIDSETPPTIPGDGVASEDRAKTPLLAPELDLQSIDKVGTPPPSPHADVVAQLEAWLRAIESRRHDRDARDQSGPTSS